MLAATDTHLDEKLKVEALGSLVLPHSNGNDAAHQCLHSQTQIP